MGENSIFCYGRDENPKIERRETDPYEINVKFIRDCLNIQDCVRIIRESLKTFEIIWGYIGLCIGKKNLLVRYDLDLSPMFQYADSGMSIVVSQKYILGSCFNYKTSLKQDVVSNNNVVSNNIETCSICYSNKKCCAYFPCGHAKYCWECTDALFLKTIPVCPECRTQIREVKQIFV